MDWAYLNLGPKLNLGINQSPKIKTKPKINSIKKAKRHFGLFTPLPTCPPQANGILLNIYNF